MRVYLVPLLIYSASNIVVTLKSGFGSFKVIQWFNNTHKNKVRLYSIQIYLKNKHGL